MATIRGLIFEADADKPRFRWFSVMGDDAIGLIDWRWDEKTDPGVFETKFDSLCKGVGKNTVRNRQLRNDMKVYIQGGTEDNKSIRRVIGMCRKWLEFEAAGANVPSQSKDRGKKCLCHQFMWC